MPKKRIPSYRLHRPSGQAVVTLQCRDFYLGQYNSKASWEEYQNLIAEYLANGRKLPPTRSQNELTVEELAVRFLGWAEGYYLDANGQPTENVEHCQRAVAPLIRHYGKNAVSEFGPISLKFIRDGLIAEKLVRSTINARINIIRQAFRWGVENELVAPDVSQALDAVAKLKKGRSAAKDNDKVPPVPNSLVDVTLKFLPSVVADMVQVQRFIGGRPQDVCNMRRGDIERTGDVWTYRPFKHKTQHQGKERSLAIGPRAQEILLSYIVRKTDDEFIFSPADSIKQFRATQRENRKSKVQPSQQDRRKSQPKRTPGERYDHRAYRRAIHRACEQAGIECWSPNQLRHTAGTETTAQFSLEAAKEFLGHASIKTTEQYYVAPLPELAAEVARKIG